MSIILQFNDLYGHQAGDDCLRKVARALAKVIAAPGRFAGALWREEFVVLLPATTLAGAVSLPGDVRSRPVACLPHAGSDVSPWVTLSLGCPPSFLTK